MALELIDLIEEFLNDMQKNNGSSTIITYRRKIYVFYEFVKLNINKTNMEYMFFLNTMDKYSLLQSVEYYVKAGNLKSRASVDIYYSVLVNFYNFLLKKFGKPMIIFRKTRKKLNLKKRLKKK